MLTTSGTRRWGRTSSDDTSSVCGGGCRRLPCGINRMVTLALTRLATLSAAADTDKQTQPHTQTQTPAQTETRPRTQGMGADLDVYTDAGTATDGDTDTGRDTGTLTRPRPRLRTETQTRTRWQTDYGLATPTHVIGVRYIRLAEDWIDVKANSPLPLSPRLPPLRLVVVPSCCPHPVVVCLHPLTHGGGPSLPSWRLPRPACGWSNGSGVGGCWASGRE